MTSIIRLTAAVNKVNCANPQDCLEEIAAVLAENSVRNSDIIVFPKLALCSASCGNLFQSQSLLEQCAGALDKLRALTEELESYVVAGLAVDDFGKTVSAMAVLFRGELVGLIPTMDNPAPLANAGFSPHLLPCDTVFSCGDLRFCILGGGLSTLSLRAVQVAQTGCDLIVVPAYSPVRAGFEEEICRGAQEVSRALGCAVAVVNGGIGDTSCPYIYKGFAATYECGTQLARKSMDYRNGWITSDLDLDVIRSQKKLASYKPHFHSIIPIVTKPGLLRPVTRTPFLPEQNTDAYLEEIFTLQVRSLVARMENTGIRKLVLGVSGGLDSTASLLVCAKAVDILELPRENIVGITMPGFGTSDRTHYNALCLLESLGVTLREIPIREAVTQHFEDIGHSGRHDTTYENAQARERTQILLDIANSVGGLVVGTGDLSEEALGFCTFSGDHLANYNVNVCIPKTLLRELVRHISQAGIVEDAADLVAEVLDTPVSPELLPPEGGDEISQKTEEILGPYELHDFFLYHFLKYRFRPGKIYFYACIAFAGKLEPAFIEEKLRLFIRKFCAGQFKRSCSPDAAMITEINLLGAGFYIPSDLDPSGLLRDLDDEPV